MRAPTGPPVPVRVQRAWLELAALTNRVGPTALAGRVDLGGVPVERQGDGDAAVLYLHGGGYTIGSPRIYRPLTSALAQAAGATVYAPHYRLAPEHPFPAALDDALACHRALLERHSPERIAFAGDSAGGGLALAAALAAPERGLPGPAALAVISPWTDLTLSGESMRTRARDDVVLRASWLRECVRHYAAGADPADPRISPLFAEPTGLPPTLVQGGSDDILASDAERFAERARAAGVDVELRIYPGMPHVFEAYPALLPEARAGIAGIGEFLRERLGRASPPA